MVILDTAGQQLFAVPSVDTTIDRLFASREGDLLGAIVAAGKDACDREPLDGCSSVGTQRRSQRLVGTPLILGTARNPAMFERGRGIRAAMCHLRGPEEVAA